MKKKWIITGIAILVILSFALIYFFSKDSFEYISPKRDDILESIYGLGKVKADNTYELKIGVMGTVNEVFVREGDHVEKNAPLIKIENDLFFKSPIAGTVTLLAYQSGEVISPQLPVLRIENMDKKYIEVSLEQQAALRVKRGQIAHVIFESLRSEKYDGFVRAIFPKSDEFLAHIEVKDLSSSILPGMTADVAIEVGKKEQALLIPVSAINNGMVTVLRDGKKKKIEIKIGHVDGMWAEVLEGTINLNDQVVVRRK